MNIVGRFLAYKGMNAAWRSATSSRGKSGVLPPTAEEDAKLALASLATLAVVLLGLALMVMSSFMSRDLSMSSMFAWGLFLGLLVGPIVFVGIIILPASWFKGLILLNKYMGSSSNHRGSKRGQRRGVEPVHLRGEAARIAAHYAAYGRERTEDEKRKLAEYYESIHCPDSDDKCYFDRTTCPKVYGVTSCFMESHELGESSKLTGKTGFNPNEPTNEKPYVVYFIQAKGGDGECKVGITYSLQSRIRSLQTGNPHELEAVHTIQVDGKEAAEQIEEAVLNAIRNAGAEMKGEWFHSAILPWAQQVADTERKRIESRQGYRI